MIPTSSTRSTHTLGFVPTFSRDLSKTHTSLISSGVYHKSKSLLHLPPKSTCRITPIPLIWIQHLPISTLTRMILQKRSRTEPLISPPNIHSSLVGLRYQTTTPDKVCELGLPRELSLGSLDLLPLKGDDSLGLKYPKFNPHHLNLGTPTQFRSGS